MRMCRLLPLSLLAALALSLAGALAAQAAVVKHHSNRSDAEVRAYWTSERMRDAKPRERARPGGGGGGATKPGASFEAPQPYDARNGKVFFTENGVSYVCSGTAVSSLNASVVWTAGHCVYDAAFSQNFLFVPAYRDGARPYGTFVASDVYTTDGWRLKHEFGVDSGAAVVGTNETGRTLNAAVGGRTIAFNTPRVQNYEVWGYPAAGKFNGLRLRVCDTTYRMTDGASPDTIGVNCDMTGGSSGGGWFADSGALVSNTSYGYGSLKGVLFGPHLEAAAQQLFSTAENS